MRSLRVDRDLLIRLGACPDGLGKFVETFPDGVVLGDRQYDNIDAVLECIGALSIYWLAATLEPHTNIASVCGRIDYTTCSSPACGDPRCQGLVPDLAAGLLAELVAALPEGWSP